MLFFAVRVVRHPAIQNLTLVVLIDGNDLDHQLFAQHLRNPAGRRRQGHDVDLFREPHLQAQPERQRTAEARRGVRRDYRERGADQEGQQLSLGMP